MILSRIKSLIPGFNQDPIDIKIDFPNRQYRLDELVDLSINLVPKSNLYVVQGTADLVCTEHFVETYTRMVEVLPQKGWISRGTPSPIAVIPTQEIKEFEEVSIHNSVVFLENTTLRTRVKREYYPKLKVQLEKSPHSDLGSTTWVVSIKIDIKDGIQVNQNKQISISIK